jgi:hypothetical protein
VIAGGDRHLDPGLRPPVESAADGEHDSVLGRGLVGAWRHHEARLADPIGFEFLDHDEGPKLLSHGVKG